MNQMHVSTATTATMPNYNTTSYINNMDINYALVYILMGKL